MSEKFMKAGDKLKNEKQVKISFFLSKNFMKELMMEIDRLKKELSSSKLESSASENTQWKSEKEASCFFGQVYLTYIRDQSKQFKDQKKKSKR